MTSGGGDSRSNSIRTRIETIQVHVIGVAAWSSLVVIPLEQGLKRTRLHRSGQSNQSLVVIPLEQGLKQKERGEDMKLPKSLVVIPLEQGLKPRDIERIVQSASGSLVVIPLEQGLKPKAVAKGRYRKRFSRSNSIRTRIETRWHAPTRPNQRNLS